MNPEHLPDHPCVACGGKDFTPLPFGYRFRGRELRGMKCRKCGLQLIHPQPTVAEVRQMYSEEYFTSGEVSVRPHGRGDYFQSVTTDRENRIYRQRLEHFRRYSGAGKLLEIGCGPGHFLSAARQAGWDTTGVEISEFASRFARETFSLNVITGTLEEANLPAGEYDVVFMGDLLEHVTDPRALLRDVRALLKDRGIVYIEVPAVTNGLYSRIGSLAMRLLGKTKYINLPPYHLFEFTPRGLRSLLPAAGFKIADIQQAVVSPRDIGLRDSPLSNALKYTLQTLNVYVTGLTGRWGDRLTVVAGKSN
ncbi:MAG: class I SAM-dependent methyltransferase [Candidatus Zixiibacteriota bacterium]|nr:MAG: class I SAM-dependent methyltransferase [candidate division Zixibacteria bacterium]